MIVLPEEPFKLVFSLYQHEYLGYLIEPFVVKLTNIGGLSFQSQNISVSNLGDFKSKLTENEVELVKLTSSLQLDTIYKKFKSKSTLRRDDFFKKVFDSKKGDSLVQEAILSYLANYRKEIFKRLWNESFFIMGSDGIPTWKEVEIMQGYARVYFHFHRETEETTYYPIIRHNNERVKFQFKGGAIINDFPAVLLVDNKLYIFEDNIDGRKISPFLDKPNIKIPGRVEEVYYKKFIVPLVANFNVYAEGFEISYEKEDFVCQLQLSEITNQVQTTLFANELNVKQSEDMKLEVIFKYGNYSFKYDNFSEGAHVYLNKDGDTWKFHKIKKNLNGEKEVIKFLQKLGLDLKNGRLILPIVQAMSWVSENQEILSSYPIEIIQNKSNLNSYFLGSSNISLRINEKPDWFDIEAKVNFGEYEIPFKQIRHYILKQIREFKLPNGQIAIIPEAWFTRYSELFEIVENDNQPRLKKQHIGLIGYLNREGILSTVMNRKLEALENFEEIKKVALSVHFKGELRHYQQAGYDWLHFLNEFNFGGCLADDMGLGKTVMTLAFLQKLKEENNQNPSLLVLPTSLIFNWANEAGRFTPDLKILLHYGPQRELNADHFGEYDLIITSYGVMRIDIDFLSQFRFNYVILDESQSIKNPRSGNFSAAQKLNARNRLILTGTPLENSVIDLWSQMSFINPGLLGDLNGFRKKFQMGVEGSDKTLTQSLLARIKPFILRRNKKQVAKELPEKIETVVYSEMSEEQEQLYEETKSVVRNQILDFKNSGVLKKSNILILQGLTKLRQIANHPSMVKEDFEGSSGKANVIIEKITEVITDQSKTLIFSQFVKHLNFVAEELDRRRIPYLYLDGSTKNRQELVDRFQNEDSELIFLISLKAGGTGLNLTAAENVFILDPWWNPAIEAQAIDRVHRIGQTKTVFIYKFITQNTIEEKIVELQNSKRRLFEDLVMEENSVYKSLTSEDILSILE